VFARSTPAGAVFHDIIMSLELATPTSVLKLYINAQ